MIPPFRGVAFCVTYVLWPCVVLCVCVYSLKFVCYITDNMPPTTFVWVLLAKIIITHARFVGDGFEKRIEGELWGGVNT